MQYQLKENVTSISVGGFEFTPDENGLIQIAQPEDVEALAQFVRDGVLIPVPDAHPIADPSDEEAPRRRGRKTE